MGQFPKTDTELKAAGYEYANSGKCRACSAAIAWYRTPKAKMIPLDEGTLEPHWATCSDPDQFRDPKPNTGPFSTKTDGYRRTNGNRKQ